MIRPRIYVAGPLTAETPEGRALNVIAAVEVAEQLYRLGWCPVVPHTYSERWHQRHPHSEEEWMELCHSLLEGCHALFRMSGGPSRADLEVTWAHELYLPAVYTMTAAAELVDTIRRAA